MDPLTRDLIVYLFIFCKIFLFNDKFQLSGSDYPDAPCAFSSIAFCADAPFFGFQLYSCYASDGYSTPFEIFCSHISIVPNPTGVSLTVPAPFSGSDLRHPHLASIVKGPSVVPNLQLSSIAMSPSG